MIVALCWASLRQLNTVGDILVAVNDEHEKTSTGTKQMGLFVVLVTKSALRVSVCECVQHKGLWWEHTPNNALSPPHTVIMWFFYSNSSGLLKNSFAFVTITTWKASYFPWVAIKHKVIRGSRSLCMFPLITRWLTATCSNQLLMQTEAAFEKNDPTRIMKFLPLFNILCYWHTHTHTHTHMDSAQLSVVCI